MTEHDDTRQNATARNAHDADLDPRSMLALSEDLAREVAAEYSATSLLLHTIAAGYPYRANLHETLRAIECLTASNRKIEALAKTYRQAQRAAFTRLRARIVATCEACAAEENKASKADKEESK